MCGRRRITHHCENGDTAAPSPSHCYESISVPYFQWAWRRVRPAWLGPTASPISYLTLDNAPQGRRRFMPRRAGVGLCPAGQALVCVPQGRLWFMPRRASVGLCPAGQALDCVTQGVCWLMPRRAHLAIHPSKFVTTIFYLVTPPITGRRRVNMIL